MTTGYIGLGSMGRALAERLQPCAPLFVHDKDSDATQALAARGATACASPEELAARCETIFLCLPTSDHVRAVIFGDHGLAAALRPGAMIVDQTTGDPAITRELSDRLAKIGVDLVDAPVSGGPEGAAAGSVLIMVGATSAQFDRIGPLLGAMSSNVIHAGGPGAGHVVKLAKNLLSAGHRVLSLEAMALAAKNGVEPERALEVMLASTGRNYFLERSMGSRILSGQLASGSTLGQLEKDLRLACDLGDQSAVPLLMGNAIKAFYQLCINDQGADAQINTAALVVDRLAGTHVVPPNPTLS